MYDTYILALRWATDRLNSTDAGVVGFVSGSGFIDKPAMDGVRRCLGEDFNSLYIFNLRGDIRKNMLSKGSAREGGNIFDSGSMSGIAISILVRNPNNSRKGDIRYFDIGDDLSSIEKRKLIAEFGSINKLSDHWTSITPNDQCDWIGQRDASFSKYLAIGDKQRRESVAIFENFSLGVTTNRDAWAVNYSKKSVSENMQRMIEFYDDELDRFISSGAEDADTFVTYDDKKISWSHHLKKRFQSGRRSNFSEDRMRPIHYRPFSIQWEYYDKLFNEYVYQTPRLFGESEAVQNNAILVSGTGARSGFSALMVQQIYSGDLIEKGQCFPLYLYEGTQADDGLFASSGDQAGGITRRDAITDEGLAHFQAAYTGEEIRKEDLFYYIYGLLHSPDYRKRFANNLAKQLPRIPAVKTFADFAAFREAGRALGDLHVNFESVEPYMVNFKEGDHRLINDAEANPDKFYRVKKMKFGGKGKDKDRTTVIYNENITMQNVPLEAYDYVVNGKPALEWVMERQVVKTDKASGIVNDANDYANETIGNPKYPLELFQRVITVSLETMKIVRELPELVID
ncbi:type ISP restriction/modification enzyme [Pseudooceanicola sp. 502str34]